MASAASDGPLAQSQNEHRDENSGSTTSAETGGGGGVKGAEVARLDALESLKDGATLAEDIELGAKTIENGKEKQDVVLPVPVAVEDADTDGTPRAWLVLFAAFSASVWAMAYPATWGIYVRTILLEGEFPGATSSTLQLAGTLAWGVMVVTTVFVGPISDKLPPQLLVTSGAIGMAAAAFCASYVNALWQFYPVAALYGIAGSFVYTPAPAMISIWFRKRRALAMGLFVSGSGVGSFINSAVAQACISAAGWRFGLKIMAAMIVGWMAPAGLLFKRKTKPKPRTGPLITLEYFKNSTFTLVFLSVLSIFFAFFMPQGFIPM